MNKKLISFAVLTAIILSIFSFSPAYAAKTVNREEYAKAGAVLTALGVEQGFDSETLMLTAKISRMEFMKKIMNILLPGNVGTENKYYFADVSANDTGYCALAAAVDMGIVSYYEGCSFRPNDALTFEEAAKLLVCVMQYSVLADARGGYPAGYIDAAKELHLSAGVANTGDSFSYGDAVMMLFNMLTLPAPAFRYETGRQGDTKYIADSGSTMMSLYCGVEEFRGTVSAIYCTGLNDSTGTGTRGKLEITDKTGFKMQLDTKDYTDLLGYRVDAFYKENTANGTYSIVYMEKDNNTVLSIDGPDVLSYDAAENAICYIKATHNADGSVRSEKEVKQQIPLSADVIYNGQFAENVANALQMLNESETYTADSVVFIDNNSDGQYDVVSVSAYRTIIADNVIDSEEEIQIIDYYASEPLTLDTSENAMWLKIKNENLEETTTLPARTKGTVFSVFESMNSSKPVVEVICSETELIGSAVRIREDLITITPTEFNPASTTIVWNPEQYGYTDVECPLTDSTYKNLKDIPLGSYYYVFRFDHNGNVAGAMEYTYMKAYKNTSTYVNVPFGIVSGVSVDEFANTLKIKMFTSTATEFGCRMDIYNTAAHFSFNSNRVKDVSDYDWRELLRSKLITYRVNSNNEITQIHTASTTRKNGELAYSTVVPEGTSDFRYKSNNGIFASNTTGKQIVTSSTDTKFFVVPDETVPASERDGYFRQAVRNHQFQNDISYRVEGYTFREDSVMSDIVLCYRGALDDIGLRCYFVVDDVSVGLNNKGEVCDMVSGMSNKNAGFLTSEGRHFVDADGNEIELKPGDVVRPYFNYDYDVIKVDRYYDFENDSTGSWANTYGGSIEVYAGDVYAADALGIAICPAGAELSFENARLYSPRSGMPVYVFDCGKKTEHIRNGSITEAVSGQKASGSCSRAFVFSTNGEPQIFVIYNNIER